MAPTKIRTKMITSSLPMFMAYYLRSRFSNKAVCLPNQPAVTSAMRWIWQQDKTSLNSEFERNRLEPKERQNSGSTSSQCFSFRPLTTVNCGCAVCSIVHQAQSHGWMLD